MTSYSRSIDAYLVKHLPDDFKVGGKSLNISRIAEEMNVTQQCVRTWMANNKLPMKYWKKFINLPGSTITAEGLLKQIVY